MTERACCFVLAVVCSVLSGSGPLYGQEGASRSGVQLVSAKGTEIFRNWIYESGFQPQSDVLTALAEPHGTLIVLFGDVRVVDQEFQRELADFVRGGGALLVATDQDLDLPFLDARITGRFVKVSRPEDGYRRSLDCPVVEAVTSLDVFQPASPRSIFLSLSAFPLATNVPSSVVPSPSTVVEGLSRVALARFPGSARYADTGRALNRDRDLFAVGGTLDDGRFLVLADHSMFTNKMLFQQVRDNSNNEFAKACLSWLRDGPVGPRRQCLFVEDGLPQSQLALPRPKTPMPPFDVLANTFLHHGNAFLGELQEKDWLNDTLLDRFGLHGTVRFVLVSLTLALVVYGLFRLWNARSGPDPSATMAAQAALVVPRGSAVRQRHAAQLALGNLYEPARERVRRHFDFLDGAEPPPGGGPPRVVVESGVPQAGRLRKEVERLWRIGYGAAPLAVPRRDWTRFNATLERIVRAAQDGRWWFESPADKN